MLLFVLITAYFCAIYVQRISDPLNGWPVISGGLLFKQIRISHIRKEPGAFIDMRREENLLILLHVRV